MNTETQTATYRPSLLKYIISIMKPKIKPVMAWAVYKDGKLYDNLLYKTCSEARALNTYQLKNPQLFKIFNMEIIKVRITPVEEKR